MKHKERFLIILVIILIVFITYYMINDNNSREGFYYDKSTATKCSIQNDPFPISNKEAVGGWRLMSPPTGNSNTNYCILCNCSLNADTKKLSCDTNKCGSYSIDSNGNTKTKNWKLYKTASQCEQANKNKYPNICSFKYKNDKDEAFWPEFHKGKVTNYYK